ncbi:FtsX-like permease family protein [Streptococcus gallolyticus]|uniref:FtsX-like permease family protein n=1 Tax=Streptococcus gallolyticus TaxID=315405 RepID=UPI00088D6A35|nr:FtsX-like permease family protein [Streptococcus gallolyticus]SDJ70653.1 putative ABC transport system permease protein [Streptococcus gallolyticus]SDL20825.1 putative ABC transport system permease protein [Streptococcus gallolyticus]
MFYAKLAWSNLRKSVNIFGPFLLTSTILFLLNCSTLLILFSPVGKSMSYGAITLGLAIVVLFIFSIIMEIYSYNFLLKQRSREFGLYNILGMNRFQISLVSTIELLVIFMGVIILGSLLSAVFSQLFYLIFINLLHYNQLVMTLSPAAFISTAFAFAAIFFFLELISLFNLRRSSPLALFRRQEQGEKEPRGNILFALLSIICLGSGYYLSISSTRIAALVVLYRFFIAVVLVIIGTYLFYISFMTWYLKRRRKNKKYFYQPEHFVTTAQMIFRMKQNAVGLANITLLAVMAFVTIATTTSLYVNTQKQADDMFPKNTQITVYSTADIDAETFFKTEVVDKLDKPESDYITYYTGFLVISLSTDKEITITDQDIDTPDIAKMGSLYIMTQDDFKDLGNSLPTLKENQTAFYVQKGNSQLEKLNFFGKEFDNVENLKSVILPDIANTYNPALLVVSDKNVLNDIQELSKQHNFQIQFSFNGYVDLSKDEVNQISNNGIISDENGLYLDLENNPIAATIDTKDAFLEDMYGFTGGFLFTGFLLGISFLLGAALIIYYKQRSEGIEDKKSYKILQEVGMGEKAVKRAINSQILIVFFMPLGFAVLHFAVALVMLKQMLLMFGVTSSSMIYTVSGITILSITVIYFFIYKFTSRTYYKIIER